MADQDQADKPGSLTVKVFEPSKYGYHQSSVEKKLIQTPSPKAKEEPIPEPAPAPATLAPRPQPVVHPRSVGAAPAPTPAPAKSKPQKAKKNIPADAKGQGKILAESVVSGFVGSIKAMAARRGGYLLAEDIAALSDSFERQTENLAASLASTMSKMSESQIKTQWDPDRINAFDRIMVKQFSHLLGDDAKAMSDSEIISRRSLAGLFAAVRMMCGPERIEQLEQDAHLVMQRVRDDQKDDFDWEIVYEDPRTKHMIRDLAVEIAPHFVDLDRRLEWLLSVINGHLTPAQPNAPGADWRLSDQGLVLVVEALFSEMVKMMDDDMGRLRITKRYGAETLDVILEVVDAIEQHRGNTNED